MRIATLLAMTLLFTAGCAPKWVHPTKSDQQWQADYEECKAQGDLEVETTTVTSARSHSRISKAFTYGCLHMKGWTTEG